MRLARSVRFEPDELDEPAGLLEETIAICRGIRRYLEDFL